MSTITKGIVKVASSCAATCVLGGPPGRPDGRPGGFLGQPGLNAYVERFIGSVRRECRDHVVVVTAAGLRRILKDSPST